MYQGLKKALFAMLLMCLVVISPMAVMAEGSHEAHSDGSSTAEADKNAAGEAVHRAVPWLLDLGDTKQIMGVTKGKSVFTVYMEQGEVLLFGAGWGNLVAEDGGVDEIIFCDPSGDQILPEGENATYSIGNLNATLTEDQMSSLSWPLTDYNPYVFKAAESGFYTLEFPGAKRTDSASTDKFTFFWDATVVGSDYDVKDDGRQSGTMDIDGTLQTGRLFTQMICLSAGNSDTALPEGSVYYILTNEGYVYSVDLSGIKPYGFYMFSDAQGVQFLDENGELCGSAYQSYDSVDNEGNPVEADADKFGVADPSEFYRIFFNQPSDNLVNKLINENVISRPSTTISVTDFTFNDGNAVYQGSGGDFKFRTDVAGTYEIAIDLTEYTYGYKEGENGGVVYLRGLVDGSGMHTVRWDGKDANGNVVCYQEGKAYDATISVKVGEIHIPLIDVEFFEGGLDVKLLDTYSGYNDKVFYNNSNLKDYTGWNGNRLDVSDCSQTGTSATGILSSKGADKIVIDLWSYANMQSVTKVDVVQVAAYKVTYDVTNGTYSGEDHVTLNEDYPGQIFANTGYELPDTITVSIGDKVYTITSGETNNGITYDKATGKITVDDAVIDGDIHIVAVCTKKDINVTVITDDETTASDETTQPKYGEDYTVTFTPDDGYEITDIKVEIGEYVYTINPEDGTITDADGNNVTDQMAYDSATGKLTIDGSLTTQDIVITANSDITYKARGEVKNGGYTGKKKVVPGKKYVGKITPDDGYEISGEIKVKIGDKTYTINTDTGEVTDESGKPVTGIITYKESSAGVGKVVIDGDAIDGDIVIIAKCTKIRKNAEPPKGDTPGTTTSTTPGTGREVPKTGDDFPVGMYVVIMIMSMMGLGFAAVGIKKGH